MEIQRTSPAQLSKTLYATHLALIPNNPKYTGYKALRLMLYANSYFMFVFCVLVKLTKDLQSFSLLQVGHVEEVDLGDCWRERITRAMKPLLFGKWHC